MSFLTGLFGTKFNDAEIESHVRTAIVEDPMLADASVLDVTSEKGIVTLAGTVHRESEKDRAEGVVRNVLNGSGLKHERVVNNLKVT